MNSERSIKLSSILNNISKIRIRLRDLKGIVESFSIPPDKTSDLLNLDAYLLALEAFPTLTLDTTLLQSIAFVEVMQFKRIKQCNKCEAYFSLLTQDKELAIVDANDSYKIIQLIDRGALKYCDRCHYYCLENLYHNRLL